MTHPEPMVPLELAEHEFAEVVVVYDNPSDYPGKAVVRLQRVLLTDSAVQRAISCGVTLFPGNIVAGPAEVFESVDEAREAVDKRHSRDMRWLSHAKQDDPSIVDVALLGTRNLEVVDRIFRVGGPRG